MRYIRATAEESPLPFEDIYFQSQCQSDVERTTPWSPNVKSKDAGDIRVQDIKRIRPYRNNTRPSPDSLSIMYVMLMHHDIPLAKRIITALNESQHHFILHIDTRAGDVYHEMTEFSNTYPNVYILPVSLSQALNWGGYSIVNATLSAMRYSWDLDVYYDYLINLSGTTYPIKSNAHIRHTLINTAQSTPPSTSTNYAPTVFVDVNEEVFRPHPEMWNHWVECDEWLHRVGRLAPARGLNMYQGESVFQV